MNSKIETCASLDNTKINVNVECMSKEDAEKLKQALQNKKKRGEISK